MRIHRNSILQLFGGQVRISAAVGRVRRQYLGPLLVRVFSDKNNMPISTIFTIFCISVLLELLPFIYGRETAKTELV